MNSKNNSPKINLFIVGAPKRGTTSMHYWLSQHPKIFMSEPKEPQFFCTDLHRESYEFHGQHIYYFKYKYWGHYLDIFKDADREKILGESSPTYLYSREALDNIHRYNPNAKIIILLRDPLELLRAVHFELLKFQESIKSFRLALGLEKLRRKGWALPRNTIGPSFLYYSHFVQLHHNIQRYRNTFPPKQIKIILLDDIKKDATKVYKEVLEFLEVENTDFRPKFKNYNQYLETRSFFLLKLSKDYNYQTLKKPFRKILPENTRKKIAQKLEKLATTDTRYRKPLNKKFELKLRKKLKPEIIKLSKLLNRDLVTLWGYNKIKTKR